METPHIQLLVAYADNRCIGKDNHLPWRLPADLAHFKRTTMGKPIIMGRHTWESLGRPLPGRDNLVISRQAGYTAEGAQVFSSLQEALQACTNQPEVCVIGGAQIYALALAVAHEIIATEIHASFDGDAFFPALDPDSWVEHARQPQPAQNGLAFDFVTYRRRPTDQ